MLTGEITEGEIEKGGLKEEVSSGKREGGRGCKEERRRCKCVNVVEILLCVCMCERISQA